jgi:hypothetical protein
LLGLEFGDQAGLGGFDLADGPLTDGNESFDGLGASSDVLALELRRLLAVIALNGAVPGTPFLSPSIRPSTSALPTCRVASRPATLVVVDAAARDFRPSVATSWT